MFIPLWALIAIVALLALNFALDAYCFVRRRHHDHLIASTPRRARG